MPKPKARLNGEGSIYQDGSSFVAQIAIKGRLHRRRRKTSDEALIKLDELRDKRRRRLSLTTIKPTFEDWFETCVTTNRRLKDSTRADYRRKIKYALPTIGHYQVDEISRALLQDLVNELDDLDLAANTIRNVVARIRSVLNRALRDRLIEHNPALSLDLPSGRKRTAVALTEEQAHDLLDAVAAHRYYALYLLALATGMRVGELLALKWSDLSWKKQTLAIRRTLHRNGAKVYENTTKTEAGQRVLELSGDMIQILRVHWTAQQEEQAIAVKKGLPDWNKDVRIFVNEVGREIDRSTLSRHFDRVQLAAKLPTMVFHDLRHTAGSLMLRRGKDMLDVSKILGHSSPAVTMAIYAHSYGDRRKEALADLAGALLKKKAQ